MVSKAAVGKWGNSIFKWRGGETNRKILCVGGGNLSLLLEEKELWIWNSVLAIVILGRVRDGLLWLAFLDSRLK